MRHSLFTMKTSLSAGCLLLIALLALAPAAITAIGTTGQLDRARKFQSLVAVPGHDDVQNLTSSFDFGAAMTSGNSDTLFVTGSLTLDKEFGNGEHELFANVVYAYGKDEDAVTTDEVLLTASWKKLYNERNYTGVRLDGRHDELADIDYRIALSALWGHYFKRDESTQLSWEGGLGYTFEKQGGTGDSFVHVYSGERFSHWVTDYTRIFQSLALFGNLTDISDYQLISELGLETYLSQDLSFKVFVQDKFDNEPALMRESNDLRVVSGVSYKF